MALHLMKMAKWCTIITGSKEVFYAQFAQQWWLRQAQTAVQLGPVFLNTCRARKAKFYWKFSSRKYLISQLVLWCLLHMSQSELEDWAQHIQSGLNLSRSRLFSISKADGFESSHSTVAEVIYILQQCCNCSLPTWNSPREVLMLPNDFKSLRTL